MAPRDISVAIIGGGIGGLTAAISLLQAGFDVRVYEQARWLSEVGAGINIGPNASRLLIRLGLRDELDKVAFRSPHFHQRRWQDGRTLTRMPLGHEIEDAFGAPHMIFHRGELHAVLAKAVPPERVHLAHRCVDVGRTATRRWRKFDNGAEIKADVLIAADGIHSTVRRILRGPERPRFASRAYPRPDPRREGGRHPARIRRHGSGRGRHFIHYFVSAGRLLNFVGHVEQDDRMRANPGPSPAGLRPARGLCGLAPAGPAHHRCGRRDLHLGGARPQADRALDLWPHHHAGRRLPPDAAVHGPRRRAGHRGRRRDHGVPVALWRRRRGRTQAL